MEPSARPATVDDIGELTRLYRLLETEMQALEETWPLADGLPEPFDGAFEAVAAEDTTSLIVGTIDAVPIGFLYGRREPMLPQSAGALIGAIRLIFVEAGAREVGVGEAMLGRYLDGERAAGITYFDAHVAPGHRLAKNFFESHGFSARRIVMHHTTGQG